jgi:hypothetical protein
VASLGTPVIARVLESSPLASLDDILHLLRTAGPGEEPPTGRTYHFADPGHREPRKVSPAGSVPCPAVTTGGRLPSAGLSEMAGGDQVQQKVLARPVAGGGRGRGRGHAGGLADWLADADFPRVGDLDPYRLGATASDYGKRSSYRQYDPYVARGIGPPSPQRDLALCASQISFLWLRGLCVAHVTGNLIILAHVVTGSRVGAAPVLSLGPRLYPRARDDEAAGGRSGSAPVRVARAAVPPAGPAARRLVRLCVHVMVLAAFVCERGRCSGMLLRMGSGWKAW